MALGLLLAEQILLRSLNRFFYRNPFAGCPFKYRQPSLLLIQLSASPVHCPFHGGKSADAPMACKVFKMKIN